MKPIKRLLVPVAIASMVAVVLALPAAGSVNKAAHGAPIYVGLDNPVQSALSSLAKPEVPPDMEAAVAQINKAGGIKGRPLAIKQCDNHFTAAGSAACYRQFADDPSIVAMVGTADCFSDASAAVLQQSGLLDLRASSCETGNFTSPQMTSIDNGLLLGAVGLGAVAAKYKTVSYVGYALAQAQVIAGSTIDAIKAGGGKLDHNVQFDPTSVDLSTPVSAAMEGNPGVLAISTGEAHIAGAIKAAAQLGYKGKIVVPAGELSAKALASLGSVANGVIGIADLAPEMAPNAAKLVPAIRQYNTQTSAVGAPQTPAGFNAWLAVYQFRDVAAKASKIDRAGLLKALKRLTNWSYMGADLPINFAKPGPFPGAPGVRTHWVAVVTAKNGQWVWNGKWIDVAPSSSSSVPPPP
jgi:branched-chain amino acid transport system substrate-binding protein